MDSVLTRRNLDFNLKYKLIFDFNIFENFCMIENREGQVIETLGNYRSFEELHVRCVCID